LFVVVLSEDPLELVAAGVLVGVTMGAFSVERSGDSAADSPDLVASEDAGDVSPPHATTIKEPRATRRAAVRMTLLYALCVPLISPVIPRMDKN
jgi:hypothetical protein